MGPVRKGIIVVVLSLATVVACGKKPHNTSPDATLTAPGQCSIRTDCLDEHRDMTGACRATPMATMGAIEATC